MSWIILSLAGIMLIDSPPDTCRSPMTQQAAAMLLYGSDDEKPVAFYAMKSAAESGDVTAMANLAAMYARGDGTPRDVGLAHRWYVAAAESGSAHATGVLGRLLFAAAKERLGRSTGLAMIELAAEAGDPVSLSWTREHAAESRDARLVEVAKSIWLERRPRPALILPNRGPC